MADTSSEIQTLDSLLAVGSSIKGLQAILGKTGSPYEIRGITFRISLATAICILIVAPTLWLVDPHWKRDVLFYIAAILTSVLGATIFRLGLTKLLAILVNRELPLALVVFLTGLGGSTGVVLFSLFVTFRGVSSPFTNRNLLALAGAIFLIGVALTGAMVLINLLFQVAHKTLQQLQNAYLGTVIALSKALEVKDHYTRGHSERVARLSLAIASEMNLSPAEMGPLQEAARFHDLGKIGVPEDVLNKKEKLTTEEWRIVQQHPQSSCQIISALRYLEPVLPVIRYHHERYDGKGYPDKLEGESIPLGARIIAVADTLDAMTSERSYRRSFSLDEAYKEITSGAGSQFCPKVIAAFHGGWGRGALQPILAR